MLRSIRDRASSWVVKTLFILLVASFAVWGVPDMYRAVTSTGNESVAEIGGVSLTSAQLRADMQQELTRMRRLFGANFDMEQARQLGLAERVVDTAVNRTLLDLAARDAGIVIGTDLVLREIFENRTFHDATGKFNRNLFTGFIRTLGLTEDVFMARLRDDLAREMLTGAITAAVKPPKGLVDGLFAYRGERRKAEYIGIPSDRMEAGTPDDAAIETYYKANERRFMAPEQRKLAVISLDPTELAKDIKVPDERIKEEYESRIKDYEIPERRHLEQLIAADEETAKKALALLKEGKAIAEIAADVTNQGKDTVDVGFVERGGTLAELTDAVFALPQGGVTDPIQSAFGWHIVRAVEVQPQRTQSLDEVRARLTREISERMASDQIYGLGTKIEDEIVAGATLEQAAEKVQLKIITVDAVSRDGKLTAGSDAPLPSSADILKEAFATPEGQTTRLTETARGGYFVVRVDKVTPATPRPLDKVRDEVVKLWQTDRRREVAIAKAGELFEKFKAGATLEAIATEGSHDLRQPEPFTRSASADAGLPSLLVQRVFAMKPGEIELVEVDTGAAVVRLVEVLPADAAADAKMVEETTEQLRDAMRGDLVLQFTAALRDRYRVSIDRKALDGMF